MHLMTRFRVRPVDAQVLRPGACRRRSECARTRREQYRRLTSDLFDSTETPLSWWPEVASTVTISLIVKFGDILNHICRPCNVDQILAWTSFPVRLTYRISCHRFSRLIWTSVVSGPGNRKCSGVEALSADRMKSD